MNKRFFLPAVMVLAMFAAVSGSATAKQPIANQYIVVLEQDADQRDTVADHRRAGARVFQTYGTALKGYAAKLSDSALVHVQADPRVAHVAQDFEGKPFLGKAQPAPTPPANGLPTGVNRIDADLSSTLAGNGSGAVAGAVAIVDTGLDRTHPDLAVDTTAGNSVNCLDATNTWNDKTPWDQHGHGTHVGGIVGADDDGSGIVGVAPGVKLVSVRMGDSAGASSLSAQVCSVDWVTANAARLGIRVANASWMGMGKPDDGNCGNTAGDPLHQAICRSRDAGVLWVFGAGNKSGGMDLKGLTGGGASYDEVLAVTGMADANGRAGGGGTISCTSGEVDDKYYTYSLYATVDAPHTTAAPAVCIYSTHKGATYKVMSGTSMAAPHAAGVAALCIASRKCVHPDPLGGPDVPFTPQQMIEKLRGDAEAHSLANPGYGFTGDPLRPVTGRYYGHLLHAAQY